MDWETSQLTFNPNWCVSSAVSLNSYVTQRQSPTGAVCRLSVKTVEDTVFNQLKAKHAAPRPVLT